MSMAFSKAFAFFASFVAFFRALFFGAVFGFNAFFCSTSEESSLPASCSLAAGFLRVGIAFAATNIVAATLNGLGFGGVCALPGAKMRSASASILAPTSAL
jgi:hypothetical protein